MTLGLRSYFFWFERPEAVIQIRFFSTIQSSKAIENLLRDKLKSGRLGQYPVDREYLHFQKYSGNSIFFFDYVKLST